MMKKKCLIAAIILSLCCLLTACSIFPDDNGKTEPEVKEKIKFTVYDGSTSTDYEVTEGETAKIPVTYKPDEYFMGAYDAQTGGTQYFDANGSSTLVWTKTLPSVFYVRYGDISELDYHIEWRKDNPYFFNGGGGSVFEHSIDSPEFMNAVKGNLTKDLYFSVTYNLSCNRSGWGKNVTWITNLKNGGEKYYVVEGSSSGNVSVDSYDEISKILNIKANEFKNGNVYFMLMTFTNITTGWGYYYKNISIHITFKNPVEEEEQQGSETEQEQQGSQTEA